MRAWPALLLAPLTALAQQAICLSLVVHACRQQTTVALHVVCAASLLAIMALTWVAFRSWRATPRGSGLATPATTRETSRSRVPRFIAIAGTLVGALSALVALLMWMPVWVLGPCMA